MYPIPANATRIRYLESSGTQYIDTGVVISLVKAVAFDIEFTLSSMSSTSFIGSSARSGSSEAKKERFYGTATTSGGAVSSGYVDFGDVSEARVSLPSISSGARSVLQKHATNIASTTQTNGANVFVFCASTSNGSAPSSKVSARLYSCTIWGSEDTMLRDFIPVRVGSGANAVGYLFDRVSGTLFGNAGTGTFVLGPDTFQQGVVPTRMMAMGVRKKEKAYPWDYRVEYFEVATAGKYFEAGPVYQYNTNWPTTVGDATSDLQVGIRNGTYAWQIYTFPQAKSNDQKICGNYGTFVAYPYSSRFNFGGWNSWMSAPTSSEASFAGTNTKTLVYARSLGTGQLQIGVNQGAGSWSGTWDASGKIFNFTNHFVILGYTEGANGSPNTSQVKTGTRFYECGFDFDIPGNLELHVRFVPCIKDNVQYICEMNSGTMISASGSGSITSGPQVADNYEAWSN